ncbi:MAG: hypothetical protein K6F30_10210 [Lachnospiraceae bacterium]|nr:hypothetical protein [Lachnospiraceae bacterium]
MIVKNCSWESFCETIKGKRLIVWGAGRAFEHLISAYKSEAFLNGISYIVDNNVKGNFQLENATIRVEPPEKLKNEKACIVLVTSSLYFLEIFDELKTMDLPDTVEIYFLRCLQLIQSEKLLNDAIRLLNNNKKECIPRIIHTFWFSGDPLPEEYQKCLDSWKKYCPDYEIKIWNQDTYDCGKYGFVKKAIEARKWAFAADVARLDVLYEYGGIYMDLDVEIYRPLDSLLCHNGVFSHLDDYIDMPVFASVKGNELLKKIMELYDGLEFSTDEEYQKNVLIQPRFVKPIFEAEGVPMEEGVHEVNGNLYLPCNVFLPHYWFDWSGKSKCGDAGYGIHHCNAGWFSDSSREERNANIAKVAALWNRIYEGKE